MKQGVEEAEVVVDVDMDVVVVEVDLIETQLTTRIHSAIINFLAVKVPLKSQMLGSPLKGVVAMVDHVVLFMVIAVVVLVMEKWEMGNALIGILNATVELDEEVISNVKELVEETGEQQLMKLLK